LFAFVADDFHGCYDARHFFTTLFMIMANKDILKQIVYSAESEIHGTGLFAKKSIRKGDYIGTFEGPEAKRNGSHVLWVYDDDDSVVGRSGKNLLRYLNHSVPGNAEFDGFDLYALTDINPHDEITFDYKEFE
jgi:SET domain-containing protein